MSCQMKASHPKAPMCQVCVYGSCARTYETYLICHMSSCDRMIKGYLSLLMGALHSSTSMRQVVK